MRRRTRVTCAGVGVTCHACVGAPTGATVPVGAALGVGVATGDPETTGVTVMPTTLPVTAFF